MNTPPSASCAACIVYERSYQSAIPIDVPGTKRVNRDVSLSARFHVSAKVDILFAVRWQASFIAGEDAEKRADFETVGAETSDLQSCTEWEAERSADGRRQTQQRR